MDLFVLGLIIAGIFMLMIFIMWQWNRATKGYKLYVRDGANPNNKPRQWFCMFNKNKDVYYVFNSILHPIQTDIRPFFDPTTFDKGKHRIDIISKPSGRADEIAWVPVALPLMSYDGAKNHAVHVSSAVIDRLNKPMKIKKKDDQGKDVEVDAITKDANGNFVISASAIESLFDMMWVVRTLGVVAIQDCNLFLLHHKVHIATAKAIKRQYEQDNLSWLARNPWAAPTAFMFIIICIGAIVYYQGIGTAVTNAQQGSASILAGLMHAYNGSYHPGTAVPQPTVGNHTTVIPANG